MPETALAFLLVFLLGLILTLAIRPMYGLYTYVFIFYVHPPSRWWGDALPDLRWSLLAAMVTLISLLVHRKNSSSHDPFLRSMILLMVVLYATWMWLQLPWVVSPEQLEGAVLFTKYVFLIYLVYAIVDNERDFHGFCMAHMFGCAYFGLLVYLAPDAGRLEGVGGPGVNDANTLAMQLSTGLIFASFLLLCTKGWIRWMILASIPLILNGIIQTEARGAMVGLFLGGLFTVYLKPKRLRRTYYFLAVLAVIGFINLANEAFIDRMQTLNAAVDEEQDWDTSAMSRIEIVKSQFRMFSDYPFGVGHQGTAYLSRKYIDERWWARDSGDRASHNTVMSVLVDQGIPGIVLFVILVISVVSALRKLKRMDSVGLPDNLAIYRTMIGGSLVSVFGAGMFAQNLKAEVQIWNLVLLAILGNFARNHMQHAHDSQNEETAIGRLAGDTGQRSPKAPNHVGLKAKYAANRRR